MHSLFTNTASKFHNTGSLIKSIAAIICLIVFTGCAVNSQLLSNAATIKEGSTGETVKSILGKPQNIQAREPEIKKSLITQWAWQYCSSTMSHDVYAIIWYEKKRVVGVDTFEVQRAKHFGKTCANYFQNIDWRNAPGEQGE